MKTSPYRGKVLRVVMVMVLALSLFSVGVQAAEFKPTKPITVIVPYAPGGGSDVYARSMDNIIKSEKLSPERFLIENKPGGSATIGTTMVAQSPGDNHMLLTFISGQVSGPLTVGTGAATYRDLTMIANLAKDEQFIVVKSDSPMKTIQDFVAAAKKQPGTITIGGTATGQEDQMCNRLFERAADIKLRYILHKVADAENIDVSAAEVDTEIQKIATQSRMTPQQARTALQKNERMDGLREALRRDKALD